MTSFHLAAAALVFAAATPVLAQTVTVPAATPAQAPANGQVTAGATVYGPGGEVVGTVTHVDGGIATVNTGSHAVPLPLSALGQGPAGPTLMVARAQLDSLVAQQHAASAARRDAALVSGANVVTADGQPLGTIEAVGADNIVLRRSSGARIALLRQYFTTDGAQLRTRLTAQDLDTAIARVQVAAPAL